jgi:prophage DNA circulation protein
MTGWRESLRPGSFRGAAFKVDEHGWQLGRRTELHEYAGRDEPWAEDLGRQARRWRVEAYVIGPDYMAARDALAQALEAPGPGVLVHPFLGVLTVAVDGLAEVSETFAGGGQALFSITFVEAGVNLAPAIGIDTAAAAAASAAAATTTAIEGVPDRFSVAGAPGFVATAAQDLLSDVRSAVESATAAFAPSIAVLGDLRAAGASLVAQAGTLITAPAAMAGEVAGLVGQIRGLAANPLAALPGLRALMGFGATMQAILGATPARDRQRRNQAALVGLVRHAAAAQAVIAVSEADFASYDQAAGIRDQLAGEIDALSVIAADAGDDAGFTALQDMRVALIGDVRERGGSLARIFTLRPLRTEPALVIAHRVYGDATRDLDIAARNRIAHPGFVPGGRDLELLSPGEAG